MEGDVIAPGLLQRDADQEREGSASEKYETGEVLVRKGEEL